MIRHQRRPGVGPLAGWRGADGSAEGRGAAEPGPGRPLHRERRLLDRARPGGGRLLQALERRLPGLGGADGLLRRARALSLRPLVRDPRPLPGGRPRHRAAPAARAPARPARPRDGAAAGLVSARRRRRRPRGLPAPRDQPAPGGDVPLLGLAERLAAPDPRREPALRSRRALGERSASRKATGRRSISPHARITVPVARMDALNPWTVWTWNAIGKRAGAWALVARRARGDPRLPAQPPDPRSSPGRDRLPTPTRSPARPHGTTSASASSGSRPRPAASRQSRLSAHRSVEGRTEPVVAKVAVSLKHEHLI